MSSIGIDLGTTTTLLAEARTDPGANGASFNIEGKIVPIRQLIYIAGTTKPVEQSYLPSFAFFPVKPPDAGKVFVGFAAEHHPDVDWGMPELMLKSAASILEVHADALVIGPGLGATVRAGDLIAAAIASSTPLVCDADALNIIAAGVKQVAVPGIGFDRTKKIKRACFRQQRHRHLKQCGTRRREQRQRSGKRLRLLCAVEQEQRVSKPRTHKRGCSF